MARYNRNLNNGNNRSNESAKAYFNVTLTLPSGKKSKLDGKSFLESFDSHAEAIEFCRVNHDKTFTFGPMQLHCWYVNEVDPNAPVKTSWDGIAADGEDVSPDVVNAVADAVAGDEAAFE